MKTFNIQAECPCYFPRNVDEDEASSNVKAFDLRNTLLFKLLPWGLEEEDCAWRDHLSSEDSPNLLTPHHFISCNLGWRARN